MYSFGNNLNPELKWPKVRIGEKKFEEIVTKHGKTSDREILIEEIFKMLSDKTV